MTKRLPFLSACCGQVFSLLAIPSFIVPFFLKLDWPLLAIPLAIVVFLWVCDLTVFVLSLTVWWNVPLLIGEEGITSKDGKTHRWADAVGFLPKLGPPSPNAHLYVRLTITYSDGSVIRFEPYLPLIKTIRAACSDEVFLQRFNHAISEIMP